MLKLIRKATENDINKINELGAQLHSNFIYTYHIETEVENSFSIVLVSEDNSIITGYLYAQELVDNIDLLSILLIKTIVINILVQI